MEEEKEQNNNSDSFTSFEHSVLGIIGIIEIADAISNKEVKISMLGLFVKWPLFPAHITHPPELNPAYLRTQLIFIKIHHHLSQQSAVVSLAGSAFLNKRSFISSPPMLIVKSLKPQ